VSLVVALAVVHVRAARARLWPARARASAAPIHSRSRAQRDGSRHRQRDSGVRHYASHRVTLGGEAVLGERIVAIRLRPFWRRRARFRDPWSKRGENGACNSRRRSALRRRSASAIVTSLTAAATGVDDQLAESAGEKVSGRNDAVTTPRIRIGRRSSPRDHRRQARQSTYPRSVAQRKRSP